MFIAVVVVALFFALITVERIGLYGVLKAIGASSHIVRRRPVAGSRRDTHRVGDRCRGVPRALSHDTRGSIPFVATPTRLLTSTAYLLLAAMLGCAFSLRRVLKVDPAAAIGAEQ